MANKNKLKSIRESQRSYLNRDFSSFRRSLTEYARTFFSTKISDFSENGLAGMFIEINAYVGDVMSYYIDHQFQELDITEATETKNIERLIRSTGVKIKSAAPAVVNIEFYLEIPSTIVNGVYVPNVDLMPTIKEGTKVRSGGGVTFVLVDDVKMGEKKMNGNFFASYSVMKKDSAGNPSSFSVMRTGICVSSSVKSESYTIPNTFKSFRSITLSNSNVNEIISVFDSEGNEYYEVESLLQDTVFRRSPNTSMDREEVDESLQLIPAARRFISTTSNRTKKTALRFGGGSSLSTDDDIMPDPSDLSLPLYGRRTTLSNFTIDPNKLLSTTTAGVAPQNTELTITYRYGGGLNHNVSEGSIRSVQTLVSKFRSSVSTSQRGSIRASIEVINREPAKGGENSPNINEMRTIALNSRNAQMRIVTKQDLIARIYSMPNKFGRVFRCSVRSNPNNPMASIVSIISRDSEEKLSVSPDTLKENLRVFLNESRLISDAIDIVDASVVNLGVRFAVTTKPSANSDLVVQKVNGNLKDYLSIENFQIGQPLMMTDLVNIIINTTDVVSLVELSIFNRTGTIDGNIYSDTSMSIDENTNMGVLNCPQGSIFEVRFPEDDIVGSAR